MTPPKKRVFKKEYARELFLIAENDLLAAAALGEHTEVRRETVLLMVQQSIEKALKSVLSTRGIAIPLTLDLFALVQMFPTDEMPPNADALDELTSYATIRRYEEGRYRIDENDIAAGLSVANEIIDWCRSRVGG